MKNQKKKKMRIAKNKETNACVDCCDVADQEFPKINF